MNTCLNRKLKKSEVYHTMLKKVKETINYGVNGILYQVEKKKFPF